MSRGRRRCMPTPPAAAPVGVGQEPAGHIHLHPDLEPPRYCVHCKRRMKVQVTPGRWSATCSVHGTVEHSTWA